MYMIIQIEYLLFKAKKMAKFYKLLAIILTFSFVLMIFPNNEFTGLLDIEKKITGNDNDKTVRASDNISTHLYYTINNLFDRFYFSLVTAIGIGYGDIVPKTFRLKLLNSLFIIFVIYFTLE
jgi:hypothetical protein